MTLPEFLDKLRLALMGRRHSYQLTFRAPPAATVLRDLARFCRAHESTGSKDALVSARLDGRREVWLRIQSHLNLTPDQLWELYSGRPAKGDSDVA